MQAGSFALGGRQVPCTCSQRPARPVAARLAARAAAAPAAQSELGFKTMRKGIKEAAGDTVLTPRFYTTDFDKMEQMFSLAQNPGAASQQGCLGGRGSCRTPSVAGPS